MPASQQKPDDYYGVLGISRGVELREIRKAFREAVLQYHPDRNPNDNEAATLFRRVVKAYEVLSDDASRSRYHSYLDSLAPSPPPAAPPAPPKAMSSARKRAERFLRRELLLRSARPNPIRWEDGAVGAGLAAGGVIFSVRFYAVTLQGLSGPHFYLALGAVAAIGAAAFCTPFAAAVGRAFVSETDHRWAGAASALVGALIGVLAASPIGAIIAAVPWQGMTAEYYDGVFIAVLGAGVGAGLGSAIGSFRQL